MECLYCKTEDQALKGLDTFKVTSTDFKTDGGCETCCTVKAGQRRKKCERLFRVIEKKLLERNCPALIQYRLAYIDDGEERHELAQPDAEGKIYIKESTYQKLIGGAAPSPYIVSSDSKGYGKRPVIIPDFKPAHKKVKPLNLGN